MNTEPNNPQPVTSTPTESLSRRTFVKKAAGTALLFGMGFHVAHAAQNTGASQNQSCVTAKGTYYCDVSRVTGVDRTAGVYYKIPIDPTGCGVAQENNPNSPTGQANCDLFTGGGSDEINKLCGRSQAAVNGKPDNKDGARDGAYCIW